MAFDYKQFDLPITEVISEIQEQLANNNTLILNAPPGAGKSTLLPLALFEEAWLKGQKIILLEPRRLAVKTIAHRLASLLGEEVGKTVGYRIRFESRVSADTRIEILTEGILTRMLQSDNELQGVGMVIFDEYHERSIHSDVAMALSRETQSVLRPDLRILIMSATLNMPELVHLLSAPVVQSQGRQYPIDIIYTALNDEGMMAEITAQTVLRALKEQKGDVLVFLPGQREIIKCGEIVRSRTNDIEVHELYGKLPQSKQQAAIRPSKTGKRKVVIASAIAETSLTIEGVTVVVDSGFGRTAQFDSKTGLSGLRTIHIAKDSADQRAGRAGRLGPGTCYRMWTKGQHAQLNAHRVPEIMEADLAPLALDLAKWGISDVNDLTWLSPPPKFAMHQATDLLENLNAIENGKITAHGKRMQKLPCHPRIAHLLLIAQEEGMSALATDIAAILEERDPLPKEVGVDINLRIEALRRYRTGKNKGGKFSRIEKIASQYRKMIGVKTSNEPVDEFETGLLLVHAYPERIAFARPGNNAQYQLANGKYAMMDYKDDLSSESWLAIAHMNAREGTGRIFLASALDPTDLKPFLKEVDTNTWNTKRGGVVSTRDTRIGSIVLKSIPLPDPSQHEISMAISKALIKEGEHLLNFNSKVQQWQYRIQTIRKLHPTSNWPDVSTPHLLQTNSEWLLPYLSGIKKPEALKKINLVEVLKNSLDYEQQKELKKLAPEHLEVPSGSSIRLEYQKNGSAPVLPVRIQEVFGLSDTPTINNGQTAVLMHLLSPGYKPAQITSDLRSFWSSTYFDVRKELRVRYKRHAWPEDPSNEPAIRGTKRQNNR
ncbi:MAG: ATP-dependent helicase HrpB [Flavobacteriaceae bacterium]|nr:MAG: ATP-dependent helicase HrpB [Flavobacteriaceae bacterium]